MYPQVVSLEKNEHALGRVHRCNPNAHVWTQQIANENVKSITISSDNYTEQNRNINIIAFHFCPTQTGFEIIEHVFSMLEHSMIACSGDF